MEGKFHNLQSCVSPTQNNGFRSLGYFQTSAGFKLSWFRNYTSLKVRICNYLTAKFNTNLVRSSSSASYRNLLVPILHCFWSSALYGWRHKCYSPCCLCSWITCIAGLIITFSTANATWMNAINFWYVIFKILN